MRPLTDELLSAIRHALVLGLDAPGALDPLRGLAEPVRSAGLGALADSIEAICNMQGMDESAYHRMLNELVRLWEVSKRIALRTQPVYRVPESAADALRSTGSPWLVLDPAPADLWTALLEGSAPLVLTVPFLQAEIEQWQPSEPLWPILLGLSHNALTRTAGDRLRQLADQAVPLLLRLIQARNLMVRIRAWEILLDLYEERAVSLETIVPHISECPLSLILVRRLDALRMPLPAPESGSSSKRPTDSSGKGGSISEKERSQAYRKLTDLLCEPNWNRALLNNILRQYHFHLMLLPDDDPVIRSLIEGVDVLERSPRGRADSLALIPHPRITQLLLDMPDLEPESLAIHIDVTKDYRLIPRLLKNPGGLKSDALRRVIGIGDNIFIPMMRRADSRIPDHFGEVTRYLKGTRREDAGRK